CGWRRGLKPRPFKTRTSVHNHRLHVGRVAGKSFHGNAGNDFFVAFEQSHLAAGDERVVVVGEVADGVALAGLAGILPLAFGGVIFCPRKCGDYLSSFVTHRVPAAVVEVKMGIDDDVDVFGRDSGSGEIREQLRGLTVELDHAFGEFVAHAGLNQDILLARADEERVQPCCHIVLFVRHDFARPHDFGNHAEKRAAIERVSAVGENTEFKIAESDGGHATSVPQTEDRGGVRDPLCGTAILSSLWSDRPVSRWSQHCFFWSRHIWSRLASWSLWRPVRFPWHERRGSLTG